MARAENVEQREAADAALTVLGLLDRYRAASLAGKISAIKSRAEDGGEPCPECGEPLPATVRGALEVCPYCVKGIRSTALVVSPGQEIAGSIEELTTRTERIVEFIRKGDEFHIQAAKELLEIQRTEMWRHKFKTFEEFATQVMGGTHRATMYRYMAVVEQLPEQTIAKIGIVNANTVLKLEAAPRQKMITEIVTHNLTNKVVRQRVEETLGEAMKEKKKRGIDGRSREARQLTGRSAIPPATPTVKASPRIPVVDLIGMSKRAKLKDGKWTWNLAKFVVVVTPDDKGNAELEFFEKSAERAS